MKKLYPLLCVLFLIYWGCEDEIQKEDLTCNTICGRIELWDIYDESMNLVYNIMVESDCPGEQCGILNIKCMDNPDSLYIIESHDFCIQNSDIGGDKFSITIYPDSVGCNSIETDCNYD
jgi:hypothetical protein